MSVQKNEEKNTKNPFQHTLNLPKTEFSIRANAAIKEPEILARWQADGLFEKASRLNHGAQSFVLHDGPPYANGHLHMGHALDYTLKDIICKAKRMEGYYAPLVPGWDCHGLPIELKVTTERGIEKDRSSVDRVTFKRYCREYVHKWIDVQREELKELGKLADYERAYITMSPEYEADILRSFAVFVEKGHIERKGKTVPWCASCQTVLAAAEIEYQDRKDPSIFVLFPFKKEHAQRTLPYCFEQDPELAISFLVWTTTPWTLPLNRAVVLNPQAVYAVIAGHKPHTAYIVAKELVDKVCAQMGLEKNVLCECDALVFDQRLAEHPFIAGQDTPILLDDMVVVGEGTACLHSAPGCGPEDYLLGVRAGLEIFSPLSHDGKYTKGILPVELEGMSIADGQIWVLKALTANDKLAHKTSVNHSYPHCWRCHNGLMFRATNQWFCDLQRNNLVERALEEIDTITFVPEFGKARLFSFVSNRTEWCISRQRQWGVPIPAIICSECDHAYLDAHLVHAVADRVAQEGIEYWDRVTIEQLIADKILPQGFSCPHCGNKNTARMRQERDILDVWFDSGVSHQAVLAKRPETLTFPADLYLEASDQHRGWFQSSLLCGMVLADSSPTKTILTHGFTVDEHRRKMSKSLGNVIAPQEVIKRYSRDILRLWVASVDYEGDVVVSEKLFASVAEIYRKIRNTCRFLISNLYDFDYTRDAVEIAQMPALDQYALARLSDVSKTIRAAYANYRFSTVVQTLNTYCGNDLSAKYLDIAKDRLYVEKPESLERRSAQTVLYHILDGLAHLMAPILSFTAEEVADFYQPATRESIHVQPFATPVDVWALARSPLDQASVPWAQSPAHVTPEVERLQKAWQTLEQMRDALLKMIETKRQEGVVKHSLEARLTVFIDEQHDAGALVAWFAQEHIGDAEWLRFVKDWLIVSQVTQAQGPSGLVQTECPWLWVAVDHAQGTKCPRCWQWEVTHHADGLCARCAAVLNTK